MFFHLKIDIDIVLMVLIIIITGCMMKHWWYVTFGNVIN